MIRSAIVAFFDTPALRLRILELEGKIDSLKHDLALEKEIAAAWHKSYRQQLDENTIRSVRGPVIRLVDAVEAIDGSKVIGLIDAEDEAYNDGLEEAKTAIRARALEGG